MLRSRKRDLLASLDRRTTPILLDKVEADGRVHGKERERYLHEHPHAVLDGSARGRMSVLTSSGPFRTTSNGRLGHTQRFGLAHVDFADGLDRRIKDSACCCARVIETNALPV